MKRLWAAGLAVLCLTGCQERLTAPADCPALCPGGSPQVFDEVVTPIITTDSSFRGYVTPSSAAALLVSNGLLGYEERAIMRFPRRSDSIGVRDTLRSYTIDSVALGFTLLARDTALGGLQLQLYRLPITIDSSATYASVEPAFVPANLVTITDIPDELNTGAIRTVLHGPDVSKIQIPPSDSGVLALGVRLAGPPSTGARLGSIGGNAPATFVTYVTLNIPDTGTARIRTLSLNPVFNTSLSPVGPVDGPDLIAVGGEPSARALLRFDLPARLRDSATIVRATLELTPREPIAGLPTDPARLQARAVLADLGAKSPVSSVVGRVTHTLELGTTGLVTLEAAPLVQLWQGESVQPSAVMLSLAPELEAASFTRPVFYSTRAADPAVWPRLRISYLLSFPFETP